MGTPLNKRSNGKEAKKTSVKNSSSVKHKTGPPPHGSTIGDALSCMPVFSSVILSVKIPMTPSGVDSHFIKCVFTLFT